MKKNQFQYQLMLFSNLFQMKPEYDQTPNEERKVWRDNLQKKFVDSPDELNATNLIEKSVKFIR